MTRLPLTVVYFEPSSGFGGSARCLRDWLLHMDRVRFRPVVAASDYGPVIKEIEASGVDFYRLGSADASRGNPSFLPKKVEGYGRFLFHAFVHTLPVGLKLARIIHRTKGDILHINTPVRTGLPGILAAALTGVPCICHLHDTRPWSRIERVLGRAVDRFVCLTDCARQKYSTYVSPHKLIRIYNGMDLGKLYPGPSPAAEILRQELNIARDERVVGMVARITAGKGHREFVQAMALLQGLSEKMRFLVIGDGLTKEDFALKAELVDLASRLGLSENMLFTGWRNDAIDLMKLMDVFVFPTTFFPEGFPLTCIEAAAQGIPIVATNIPGPSEIVVDGETGFLVRPGSSEEIADAVRRILEDSTLSARFSQAGRKRAESFFDIKKIVRQIEIVYEELVQ